MDNVQVLLDEATILLDGQKTPVQPPVSPVQQPPVSPVNFQQGIYMDTKVIMFDGRIKLCYELNKNDLLMGDDSNPRQILEKRKVPHDSCKLFRVKQNKGMNYILNQDNYISLKLTRLRAHESKTKVLDRELVKNDIIDIRLQDFMKMSQRRQFDFKAFKAPVEFKPQSVPLDPYLFGIWVIDASVFTNEVTVTIIDILEECFNITSQTNMTFEYYKDNRYLLEYVDEKKKFNDHILKAMGLLDVTHKFIPLQYKCNSRENRLRLLAGIIDCEGTVNNNCCELTMKNELLASDILFLCNSLGFYASKSNQKNRSTIRLIISGELSEIPLKNKKKITSNRKQTKNILHTGLVTEPVTDVNDCYELVLDGNGRFLLEDFTVMHC